MCHLLIKATPPFLAGVLTLSSVELAPVLVGEPKSFVGILAGSVVSGPLSLTGTRVVFGVGHDCFLLGGYGIPPQQRYALLYSALTVEL